MTSRAPFATALAVAALATGANARAESAPEPAVSLGPDFGFVARSAKSDGTGVGYGAGLAYGGHAQTIVARWLRVSLYALASSHALDLPARALTSDGDASADGSMSAYVLGARVQPTLALGRRARVWASVGAGWGKLRAPSMHVAAPGGGYSVAPRDGVMLEIPVGVGGQLDVVRRLVSVGADVAFGPIVAQTGDLYDRVQAIDASGRVTHVGGLPEPTTALTAVVSVTLSL